MKKLAGKMTLGPDGIWGDVNDYNEQENEKKTSSVCSTSDL